MRIKGSDRSEKKKKVLIDENLYASSSSHTSINNCLQQMTAWLNYLPNFYTLHYDWQNHDRY